MLLSIKYGNFLTEREFKALKKTAEEWVLQEVRKRLCKRTGKLFTFYGNKKGGYLSFGNQEFKAKKPNECRDDYERDDENKYNHQILMMLNFMIEYVLELSEEYDLDIIETKLENSITEFKVIRSR